MVGFSIMIAVGASLALAEPAVSFSVSEGISNKREQNTISVQTKLHEKLYSIEVHVPKEYSVSTSDVSLYKKEASLQLQALQTEFQNKKILQSSYDAEWADLIFRTLKVHTDSTKFVAENDLTPLLPHSIFQIQATPESEKDANDVVDTRSVALLAALSTACDMVKYPILNPGGVDYEYGVWCNGSSYTNGYAIHSGSLIASHPDLLYPNLAPADVYRWEDGEALKLAYGQEAKSDTLIPSQQGAEKKKEEPNTEPSTDEKEPTVHKNDSVSSMAQSTETFYVFGGLTVCFFCGYLVYQSNRKKRITEMKKEIEKKDIQF